MDPAALNTMLEGRVKELTSMRRGNGKDDLQERLKHLLQAAGIDPLPPRTDLNARVTGSIPGEGFRIDKLRFESWTGLLAAAHLYMPEGRGPWPLIVSAHGIWKGKKAAPVVQARGISFALRGFATLIVDAPGSFGDDLSLDERGGIGAPGDPSLIMGAPWIGVYAWDLVRAIDCGQGRPDLDLARIGITGEGEGGIAALIAFTADPRIACAALVCTAPTMEQKSLESIAQLGIPGLSLAGDFSDMLAIRAPAPVLIAAAREDDRYDFEDIQRTAEKLGRQARFEAFEGGHDYNRRMREAVGAFFAEHLQGNSAHPYLPELRPLTDGALHPAPGGTWTAEDPQLLVTDPADRPTITFKELLADRMAHPFPQPFHAQDRLVPWPKYANPGPIDSAATFAIHDASIASSQAPGSIPLPAESIDLRLAAMVGLSIPEFLAQVLHVTLPGKPEGWEREALAGGEGLSAMIASLRTLAQSASSEPVPTKVIAEGPIASLTAMFLQLYRPGLIIETSHSWSTWRDLLAGPPPLIQPLARYLVWPFAPASS